MATTIGDGKKIGENQVKIVAGKSFRQSVISVFMFLEHVDSEFVTFSRSLFQSVQRLFSPVYLVFFSWNDVFDHANSRGMQTRWNHSNEKHCAGNSKQVKQWERWNDVNGAQRGRKKNPVQLGNQVVRPSSFWKAPTSPFFFPRQ